MKSLIVVIVISFLFGCKQAQDSNAATEQKAEGIISTEGTSSGGGTCSAEFSCRFANENKTTFAMVALCGKLALAEIKDNQWSYTAQVESNRWTIYRDENEYVLLFKRKLRSHDDATPWIQLEVKLEQRFHEGVNKNGYPALLSGELNGINQFFNNEKMICQPGWLKNLNI